MLLANRLRVLCLAVMAGGMLTAARADEAPAVGPSTALMVLDGYGSGFANMRAAPDPRSEATARVPAGSTDVHATGKTARYGDTWWIEVQTGSVTGWFNARLIGDAQNGKTPLQAFINIDALQPLTDYEFTAPAVREAAVTSYDECARVCVADVQCQGIQFTRSTSMCAVYDQRPAARRHANSDIALKPFPAPAGGWFGNTSARFDRTKDQSPDSDGVRDHIARSSEECAFICSADAQCGAYTFQRKKLLCSVFERTANVVSRAGSDYGVRVSEKPAADASPLLNLEESLRLFKAGVAAVAAQSDITADIAAGLTSAKKSDTNLAEPLFRHIFEEAAQTAAYATSGINRTGHVTIAPRAASAGDLPQTYAAMQPALPGDAVQFAPPVGLQPVLALPQKVLQGDVHNLAPLLDMANPGMVHLVFYAKPTAPPVVLATASHNTEKAAVAAALKMQRELDDLARMTGLGSDPLALLKPLRR